MLYFHSPNVCFLVVTKKFLYLQAERKDKIFQKYTTADFIPFILVHRVNEGSADLCAVYQFFSDAHRNEPLIPQGNPCME